MKKYCFVIFLFFSLFSYSQNIPNELYGIWESKDRYVFFEKTEEQNQIAIYLKTYYGWYVDRTVEPEEYAQKEIRARNSATPRNARQVSFSIENIFGLQNNQNFFSDNAAVFEINLSYSKNDGAKIPVAIVGDALYLNFYVQDYENPDFYRGNAVSEGIKTSVQKTVQNISGLYFFENSFFDIRYWLTDMDYENSEVSFEYAGNTFFVPGHIFSAGNNYSCVSGRSKKIRNVVQPFPFEKDENSENFIYYGNDAENTNQSDERTFFYGGDKSVLIFDKSPHLTKLLGKNDFEHLTELVKNANSRRKPEPAPLFSPNNLDWHWDLIDYIEKDNELIQKVRQRQKEFGPRAKDLENKK